MIVLWGEFLIIVVNFGIVGGLLVILKLFVVLYVFILVILGLFLIKELK